MLLVVIVVDRTKVTSQIRQAPIRALFAPYYPSVQSPEKDISVGSVSE